MILPMLSGDKRPMADFPPIRTAGLVDLAACASIEGVDSDSLQGLSSTHLDHTPSPQGQWRTAQCPLPRFFGICCRGGVDETPAPGAEPQLRSDAGPADGIRQGRTRCLTGTSFSRLRRRSALRPAATRWANRPLAVPPLARASRRSPAAALRRALPSAPRAMSPTADFIPADVTDPRASARPTSSKNSARRRPQRGFCMPFKTQKDPRCSRKS